MIVLKSKVKMDPRSRKMEQTCLRFESEIMMLGETCWRSTIAPERVVLNG